MNTINEILTISTKNYIVLPIGISGSGKSTWIKVMLEYDDNLKVISPDDIRREITGTVSDQTKNGEVFRIAYDRVVNAMNNGNSVIFDATNIRSRERRSLLAYIDENVYSDVNAYAKIFDVDPEICKDRIKKDIMDGVDRSNVSDEVIDKQYTYFKNNLDTIEPDGYKII